MPENAPLLLNSKQAAEYLGLGIVTFREWSQEPDFTAKPVTRSGSSRKYWRRADLARIGETSC